MRSPARNKLLIGIFVSCILFSNKADAVEKAGNLIVTKLVPIQPDCLFISAGSGNIEIHFDGKVILPTGIEIPEAAKLFWDAVDKAFPAFRESILVQERLRQGGKK